MLGGASAALAGLVFVGLSVHVSAVAADPLHRMRARNLTAGILLGTLASALMLTPGQSRADLGIELIVSGLVLASLFAFPLVRFSGRIEWEFRARSLIAICACLLIAAAGATLWAHAGGGIYLLVPATVGGLTMNVFGAWSLLLGLARPV